MRIPQFVPINTVHDLVNQNVTVIEYYRKFNDSRSFYLGVNTSDWDNVANTLVPVSSYYCCCCSPDDLYTTWQYFIKYHVHGNKTHAFLKGFLTEDDLEVKSKSVKAQLPEKITITTTVGESTTVSQQQSRSVGEYNNYILNRKTWWRSDKIEIGTNPYNLQEIGS